MMTKRDVFGLTSAALHYIRAQPDSRARRAADYGIERAITLAFTSSGGILSRAGLIAAAKRVAKTQDHGFGSGEAAVIDRMIDAAFGLQR